MKKNPCVALLLSAVLTGGLLAGCGGVYDPADVEDPAGVGTAACLGDAGAARLSEAFRSGAAGSGLAVGDNEQIQDALNRALTRRTAPAGTAALGRSLENLLRREGMDAELSATVPEMKASGAELAGCIFKSTFEPANVGQSAAFLPVAVREIRRMLGEDAADYELYLSVEDCTNSEAAYALLMIRT